MKRYKMLSKKILYNELRYISKMATVIGYLTNFQIDKL